MKAYSKGELASLYMPNVTVGAAREFLRLSILNNKELESELIDAGYTKRNKILTPKQIKIIYKHLGEP